MRRYVKDTIITFCDNRFICIRPFGCLLIRLMAFNLAPFRHASEAGQLLHMASVGFHIERTGNAVRD